MQRLSEAPAKPAPVAETMSKDKATEVMSKAQVCGV